MAEPKHRFQAVLEKDDETSGTGVPIRDVEKLFGTRGRVPVRGTLNGASFRSTLAPFGDIHYLPVNRALREAAKAQAGEKVELVLERDSEPRVIEAPPDLKRALEKNQAAAAAWERLSYSHKREYASSILEAKKPETRERRIAGALARLARPRSSR